MAEADLADRKAVADHAEATPVEAHPSVDDTAAVQVAETLEDSPAVANQSGVGAPMAAAHQLVDCKVVANLEVVAVHDSADTMAMDPNLVEMARAGAP